MGNRRSTCLIPHRRPAGGELTDEQETDNKVHRKARARVERVLSRMKNWKILRDVVRIVSS
ncbi:transposase family protein [Streptomyces sp. HUAS TT7]|uniref:transposase family protein n=1 Tax=Streptomyces sp. HUAS TT7 TaxID=3447507 RepID=UPI003F65EEBB